MSETQNVLSIRNGCKHACARSRAELEMIIYTCSCLSCAGTSSNFFSTRVSAGYTSLCVPSWWPSNGATTQTRQIANDFQLRTLRNWCVWCVWVCECVSGWVGACVCVCVYVKYLCMYVCMYVCRPACLPACMHACMRARTCKDVCVGTCVRMYVYSI